MQRKMAPKLGERFVDIFNPGDLIYGLGGPRQKMIDQAKSYGLNLAIDQYNNTIGISPTNSEAKREIKAILDDREWTVYSGEDFKTPEYKTLQESEKHFIDYLNGPLLKKYDPSSEENKAADKTFQRIRRACKAGIQYAVDRGKKVHFCLDDLEIKQIMDQRGFPPQTLDKSATNSELKFIYKKLA